MARIKNNTLGVYALSALVAGRLRSIEVPAGQEIDTGDEEFSLVETPMVKARIDAGMLEYDGGFSDTPSEQTSDGKQLGKVSGTQSWLPSKQGSPQPTTDPNKDDDKFDPEKATVEELRDHLTQAGVAFPATAKKDDLVKLAKDKASASAA